MNPRHFNRKPSALISTMRCHVVWMAITVLLLIFLAVQAPPLTAEPTPGPAVSQAAGQSRPLPLEVTLAPGTFLVASRRLHNLHFAQTVILLIAYDENGAQGVVINRPSPIRISRALPDLPKSKAPSPYIYIGGPVAQTQMRILVQTDKPSEGMQHMLENVYLSGSPEVLKALMTRAVPTPRFRTFAGYVGWGPGQLEREIERGGWHIFYADVDTIFDPSPGSVWSRLIRKRDLKWM